MILVRCRECGTGTPMGDEGYSPQEKRMCTTCGHTFSPQEVRGSRYYYRGRFHNRYFYQKRKGHWVLAAHPLPPLPRRRMVRTQKKWG